MSEDIMKTHRLPRRNALVALAMVTGATLVFYFLAWPWLTERLSHGAPEERLRYLGWLMFALFSPCFIFAGYFGLLRLRISRSGQYPPSGMKVIRDTKILRGRDAQRVCIRLIALSHLLIMLFVIGGIWFPWIFLNQYLPRFTR